MWTPAAPAASPAAGTRLVSIDLLRGTVMALMVIDHARDLFCSLRVQPTDLAATTPALFFTRFVTHVCAPVFVSLAGTAAWLSGARRGPAELSRFLATRGLWLILLELTIVRLCLFPDFSYRFTALTVLWALGWSMLALAVLCRLPAPASLLVGVGLTFGHNLLDRIDARSFGALAPLWKVLHQPGWIALGAERGLLVAYPLLPWIGVMALGFACGPLFARPPAQRRRVLWQLGLAAIAAFLVLRGFNLYGNPRPWSVQPRGALFTLLSFLNTEKYPPSLHFLLMTLGPALCALAAFEAPGAGARPMRVLLVFGRVPLFFFVAHLALLRLVSAPLALARHGPGAFAVPPTAKASPDLPMWAAYVITAITLIVLYPLCRWFAAQKARRPDGWLRYG